MSAFNNAWRTKKTIVWTLITNVTPHCSVFDPISEAARTSSDSNSSLDFIQNLLIAAWLLPLNPQKYRAHPNSVARAITGDFLFVIASHEALC
jgi:hypothetical protein